MSARVVSLIASAVLVIATACSESGSPAPSTASTLKPAPSTSVPSSSPTAPPDTAPPTAATTTVAPTTTSTTSQVTIADSTTSTMPAVTGRQEFLRGLEDAEWQHYRNAASGWGVFVPPTWSVFDSGDGALVFTDSAGGYSIFWVDGADAYPSIEDLVIALVSQVWDVDLPRSAIRWLDRDFDHQRSAGDLAGFSGEVAVDLGGSPLPAGQTRPAYLWVHYDPASPGTRALVFQSVQVGSDDSAVLDAIGLSLDLTTGG